MGNETFKYDIFISYKHEETDRKVAQYLQKALEQYKIPKEIQKKTGKSKIKRVFRDEEELAVASDLSEEIEEQLRQTEFLLVICSKKTRESIWVQREIQTFLKYRSRRYVLPVLVDGEPEESFPEIILKGGEPLAADFRGNSQKEILANAKKELPRIIAPVLDCSYDELKQRHKAYRMKRISWICGIVAAIAVTFGAYSVKQNIEIKENYTKKQENQSRYLAQTSAELLESGDREAAMLVALAALPESEADESRPLVAEARMALEASLYLYQGSSGSRLFPYKKENHAAELKEEFSYYNGEETFVVVRDDNGCLYVRKGDTLELVLTLQDAYWKNAVFNQDGKLIANSGAEYSYAMTDRLVCMDPYTGEIIWEKQPSTEEYSNYKWMYNAGTDQIALIQYRFEYDFTQAGNNHTEFSIMIIDASTGQEKSWQSSRMGAVGPDYVELSPTGNYLAVMFSDSILSAEEAVNELYIYQCEGGELLFSDNVDGWLTSEYRWIEDDTFAASFSGAYSMGWVGEPTDWKLVAWDISNQKVKWIYQDESLNLADHIVIDTYDVKNEEGEEEKVVSVIANNTHLILNLQNGTAYNRMENHNVIQSVFLLQSGRTFLYVMQTGDVYLSGVYETMSYNPIWDYDYELGFDIVTAAYHIGSVLYVIEGESLHTFHAINEVHGTELENVQGLLKAQYSEEGNYFYCTTSDTIILSKTDTGETIGQFEIQYTEKNADFIGDRILAYISPEKSLKLYNIETKTEKQVLLGSSYSYQVIAVAEDKILVWSTRECYLIDGANGTLIEMYQREELVEALKANGDSIETFSMNGVMLTEDEKHLIFIDSDQGIIRIWNRENQAFDPLPEDGDRMIAGGQISNVYSKALDSRGLLGNQIVLYGDDKKIRIYDIDKNEIIYEKETEGIGNQHVIFTPDGDYLVFINGNNQLRVLDWKKDEYTVAGLERLNQYGTAYFDFSSDGSELYVRSVETISTPIMHFYEMTEEGVYKKDTAISYCYGTNGSKLILRESGVTMYADKYTLDELIAMAKEKLNGRELTAEEKNEYLIED